MSGSSKPVVVIGLGNPLVEDEGVGPAVLVELKRGYSCEQMDVVDLGTNAFSIIHLLENRKTAVIIDCAFMGLSPGEMRRFTPDQAESGKQLAHASLHEADILSLINLHRSISDSSPEIVIFGIEPEGLREGKPLSALLESRLVVYACQIACELGLA